MTFSTFNLPSFLNDSLEKVGFTTPTPIQQKAIPLALQGKDILGSAQTGTGKTGAFLIPLLTKLITNPESSALVITPTRELAQQVHKEAHALLGRKSPLKSALIIGGDSINKQLQQIQREPRLFVGTPGRLNDFISRGSLDLSAVDFLVLDETDRMLDMGFSVQIETIVQTLKTPRQTLLFSATLPKSIMKIANEYLRKPEVISIGQTCTPAQKVEQKTEYIEDNEKYDALLKELESRDGSVIIFVKTKYGSARMAKRLTEQGYRSDALHGDLRQNKRDRVIKNFRQEKYRVLVATDVAARGLDIPHIKHVINYDLPSCPSDYIHRIGRTGRAGAEGYALNFVSSSESRKWERIDILLHPENKKLYKNSGKKDSRSRKRKDERTSFRKERSFKERKSKDMNFDFRQSEPKKSREKKFDRFDSSARGKFSKNSSDKPRFEEREGYNSRKKSFSSTRKNSGSQKFGRKSSQEFDQKPEFKKFGKKFDTEESSYSKDFRKKSYKSNSKQNDSRSDYRQRPNREDFRTDQRSKSKKHDLDNKSFSKDKKSFSKDKRSFSKDKPFSAKSKGFSKFGNKRSSSKGKKERAYS